MIDKQYLGILVGCVFLSFLVCCLLGTDVSDQHRLEFENLITDFQLQEYQSVIKESGMRVYVFITLNKHF